MFALADIGLSERKTKFAPKDQILRRVFFRIVESPASPVGSITPSALRG
jgi:hypothetical protein